MNSFKITLPIKNTKELKKDLEEWNFLTTPNRIKSLVNFDMFEKRPFEYKDISRFTVKQGEMVQRNVTKTKFSQLNDKRF